MARTAKQGMQMKIIVHSQANLRLVDDDDIELHVLRRQLTYQGQTVTTAEAWFDVALPPQKL